MKNYKDIGIYDFSDYAEEVTGNALFKINGGEQIQNSIKAQANANVGDTVTNSKGETHTLTQADINWAQQQLGTNGNTPTGSNNAQNPGSGAPSGYNPGSSNGEKNTNNSNESDSDKRYNAQDYKGQHLMTINCDDKENFEEFASYYITVGQFGSAQTTIYDGIGLTDKNGNIIHVLKDENSIMKYAEYLNPSLSHNLYSPYNKTRPELNSTIIENNQEKTEREVYFEKETSRYGSKIDLGISKVSSKTLSEGPAGNLTFNLLTANLNTMNSPDSISYSIGAQLIGVGGEVGFNVSGKRFTIGGGLSLGFSLGFEKTSNSISVDLGPLKGITFSWENN